MKFKFKRYIIKNNLLQKKEFWFHSGEYGLKRWFLNDHLHREDGPALESYTGIKQWFLHGFNFEEEIYWAKISRRKNQGNNKK